MKVFLNSNFEIENISNESGDPIVRGSDKFNKLHIFVPTSTVNSYNTISPLYSVKRADGRILGNYATITTHDNTEAFNGYYGWKGDFNPRDIAVAGALELTISFKMKKTAASVEMTKTVAKITLEVKEAAVALDDVLVLGDGGAWTSLSDSIASLTSNLGAKADLNNNQQSIVAGLVKSTSFKKGDAELATETQVSEEATARQQADNALQTDINTRVKIADIINALNDTSTNKPLSAYQGKLLKDAIDGINALLQSDDTNLDELQEIVTYIKNNKSLIDGITSSKISYTDIVDNLTSELANKPLSAKQGYILKGLIDALQTAVNNRYTKSEADTLLNGKADKSTTYTKTQVNNLLSGKQDITIPAITIAGVEYTNLEAAISAINEYAKTIEQVIGSISGSDTTIATRLTQLESSVSSLNSAWTTFTTGTSADNIINTLVEIQQELANFNIIVVNDIDDLATDSNARGTLTEAQFNSITPQTTIVAVISDTVLRVAKDIYKLAYYSNDMDAGIIFYNIKLGSTTIQRIRINTQAGTATSTTDHYFVKETYIIQKSSDMVTSWSQNPSNENYPSEKLVKDSLDSETSRATTQENKSLYHLGAFDSADGKTRRSWVASIKDLTWTKTSNNRFETTLPSAMPNGDTSIPDLVFSGTFTADTPDHVYSNVAENTATITSSKYFLVYVSATYYANHTAEQFIADYGDIQIQYKLATAYTDTPIENESILPLDTTMAQMIRQDIVEGLNLFTTDSWIINRAINVSYSFVGKSEIAFSNISGSDPYAYMTFNCFEVGKRYTITVYTQVSLEQWNIAGVSAGSNASISFIALDTKYEFGFEFLNSYSSCNIKIMIVEGNHPYPYEPYHASKHITDEEATNLHNAEGVLLWENSSPNSSFAEQTITTADMSGYKYIVFEYLISHSVGDGFAHTFQKFKRSSTVGEKYVLSIASYGQGVAVCYREIENYSSNANQLKIMAGKYVDSSTNETNNDVCVPIAIYGTNIL